MRRGRIALAAVLLAITPSAASRWRTWDEADEDRSRGIIWPEVAAAARDRTSLADAVDWVRKTIVYEPYVGALRGARGTIAAGAGNSVDQALLLYDLARLIAPAPRLRFASSELDGNEASRLVSDWISARRRAQSAAAADADPALVAAAETDFAKAADSRRHLALTAIATEWRERALRIHDDTDRLGALLRTAATPVTESVCSSEELVAAARKHVWLQCEEGGGWRDLDPILTDGPDRRGHPSPLETHATLPEATFHHVSFNVVVEFARGGELLEDRVLESDWRSADLSGSSIALLHAEPWCLDVVADSTEAMRQGRCTPLLVVDDEQIVGRGFRAQPERDGDGVGAVTGLRIQKLLGGGSTKSSDDSDVALAEWLEIVVQAPDGSGERHVRPLFDRIGAVARAAKPPLDLARIDRAASPAVERAIRSVWTFALWSGEKPRAGLSGSSPCAQAEAHAANSLVDALATLDHSYFRLLQQIAERASPGILASAVVDSPHLFALGWLPGIEGSDTPRDAFLCDAIRNVTRWLPIVADPGRTRRLWAQCAVHAEDALTAVPDWIAAQTPQFAPSPRSSVPRVFEDAARRGWMPVALDASSIDRLDRISASPEARCRIRAHLDAGQIVVVPMRTDSAAANEPLGWWFVDPRDGFTCDEMENGRRQVGTESTGVRKESEKEAAASSTLAQRIRRGVCALAVGVSVFLHGVELAAAIDHGDVGGVATAIGDLADEDVGKALENCLEGAPPPLTPPKSKDLPRFPRPQNWKLPKGPMLPKRVWKPAR